MTVLRTSLTDLYAPILAELELFGKTLREELASPDPLIREIHEHLLKMSGKFLRPALTLLSSKLETGAPAPAAVRLAVAIELIHTATLVHDDIIDASELRRNQPAVHTKWGREISIVAGDHLYAKAFVILAGLEDHWVNQAFATCAGVICQGEMKQIEKRKDFARLSESEYIRIIEQKTASLFQASCAAGAYLGKSPKERIVELGRYGYHLGLAFQIVDDCLDLTGQEEVTGKTAGLDLYQNDVSLPLLYLFEGLEAAERRQLLGRIQKNDPSAYADIRALASSRGALEKALAKARSEAGRALSYLKNVPPSPYRESLAQLCAYCTDRVR